MRRDPTKCDGFTLTIKDEPFPKITDKQYLSIRYTERLADASIEPSVGSRGDSYDNPPPKR